MSDLSKEEFCAQSKSYLDDLHVKENEIARLMTENMRLRHALECRLFDRCPYDQDGCLLEEQEVGPCLCANPPKPLAIDFCEHLVSELESKIKGMNEDHQPVGLPVLPAGMTNEEFYKEQAEYWRQIASQNQIPGAAQTAGHFEALQAALLTWFNTLPGESLGKKHWQRLVEILKSTPDAAQPPAAPVETLSDVIASIPADLNWLIGKGKTRPDEPPFGVQLIRGMKVIAETEGDDLYETIKAAVGMTK